MSPQLEIEFFATYSRHVFQSAAFGNKMEFQGWLFRRRLHERKQVAVAGSANLLIQILTSSPALLILDHVRVVSHNFGYGVGDYMDSLLARHRKA